MRNFIKKVPVLRKISKAIYATVINPFKRFSSSEEYWQERYLSGGNSGPGSYDKRAEFKAEILNTFVKDKGIKTVIEYGCGDGNQLKLAEYPSFIGFDISQEALDLCEHIFSDDKTKSFKLNSSYTNETAQLTLSLDVIYHLVEDGVYYSYMDLLFDSSTEYVIIYSSNTDEPERYQLSHVKHREFSSWIEKNRPDWKLFQHIPNKYPRSDNISGGSLAEFYIYKMK